MFLSNLQKEKKEYFVYVYSYSISLFRGQSNIIFHLGREGGGGLGFYMKSVRKWGGGGGIVRSAIHSDLIWIIQIFFLKFNEIQMTWL